jgi:hypothetical protein
VALRQPDVADHQSTAVNTKMPNGLSAIQDDLVQSSAVDGDVEACGNRDRLGQYQIRTIDAKQDSPALEYGVAESVLVAARKRGRCVSRAAHRQQEKANDDGGNRKCDRLDLADACRRQGGAIQLTPSDGLVHGHVGDETPYDLFPPDSQRLLLFEAPGFRDNAPMDPPEDERFKVLRCPSLPTGKAMQELSIDVPTHGAGNSAPKHRLSLCDATCDAHDLSGCTRTTVALRGVHVALQVLRARRWLLNGPIIFCLDQWGKDNP